MSDVLNSSFSLANQVALVTGGSRGIGAAIAKELAQAGATVIVNYQSNASAAQKVVEEIKAWSPQSEAVQFDISKADEVDAAIAKLIEKFQNIHVLVCNAGISRDNLLPRLSAEDFLTVLQTNLLGTVNCVKAVTRPMMKNRYGRIVALSSVVGESGNKGQSAYAASKSALFGFSKSVALEFASRNITMNVICPGFIETEMTASLDDQVKQDYFKRIPVGRFGKGSEVAAGVRFLVSQEAGYITGTTLDINGGMLMR